MNDNFDDMFDDMSLDGFEDDSSNSGGSLNNADIFGDSDEEFGDSFTNDMNNGGNNNTNISIPQGNILNNLTTDSSGQKDKNKIYAIIGVSVVALVIIIIVAIFIGKSDKKQNNDEESKHQVTSNQNVDNIMSTKSNKSTTNKSNPETVVVNSTTDSMFTWTEITDFEALEYNTDYTELTFTITDIKHYVRTVDVNKNLSVKTSIIGSISGLSGTYVIDVPYEKGRLLQVGNSFTVQVKMASYKGRTVVDEIKY